MVAINAGVRDQGGVNQNGKPMHANFRLRYAQHLLTLESSQIFLIERLPFARAPPLGQSTALPYSLLEHKPNARFVSNNKFFLATRNSLASRYAGACFSV
jgi:hypothetical protein